MSITNFLLNIVRVLAGIVWGHRKRIVGIIVFGITLWFLFILLREIVPAIWHLFIDATMMVQDTAKSIASTLHISGSSNTSNLISLCVALIVILLVIRFVISLLNKSSRR